MVIVIAIAIAIACTHQSQKISKPKQQPAGEASLPYLPCAFVDMALFPGNVFEVLINHL
jgi:hypothetical protein